MRLESRWIGPAPADAPTLVILDNGSRGARSEQQWGGFPDALSRATGCGVCVCSSPSQAIVSSASIANDSRGVVARTLDAIGFSHGILIGYDDTAALATIYTGGVADHRVRGLILIAPRFVVQGAGGWDIRESIGYIRVPILIVRGSLDQVCTNLQIDVARDEAYCPIEVAQIEGAGVLPHQERSDHTLAVIGEFVSTLFTTFGEGRTDRIRSEREHVRSA